MLKRIKTRLKQAIARRKKWRRTLRKREAREKELRKALKGVRRENRRKRDRLRKLRDEDRRPDVQEALAEEIEANEAEIDRLLLRLDAVKDKSVAAERELALEKRRVEQLRRKRKKIKEQQEDRISAHFVMAEFDCRQGGPVPEYMRDDLKKLAKLFLEPMREKFGPAHVNSGHRWTWYNRLIGGAPGSYHCYEVRKAHPASDVFFANGTPAQWAAYARQLADRHGFGGVGQYATFVHVDTRSYRSNWWG